MAKTNTDSLPLVLPSSYLEACLFLLSPVASHILAVFLRYLSLLLVANEEEEEEEEEKEKKEKKKKKKKKKKEKKKEEKKKKSLL